MLYIFHLLACFHIYFRYAVNFDDYIDEHYIDESIQQKHLNGYLKTIYYVVVTTSTLGYGEITPEVDNRPLMFQTLSFMFVGIFFFPLMMN